MGRYYCPQLHDWRKGWVDIESMATTKQKEADDNAKALAELSHKVARVVRKPKGWSPPPCIEEGEGSSEENFDYAEGDFGEPIEDPLLEEAHLFSLVDCQERDPEVLWRLARAGELLPLQRLIRLLSRGYDLEEERFQELVLLSHFMEWAVEFQLLLRHRVRRSPKGYSWSWLFDALAKTTARAALQEARKSVAVS